MDSIPADNSGAGRRALLAGATGLVGREILRLLLDDPAVSQVQVLARRALPQSHPKLRVRQVDFRQLGAVDPCDEAYLALGTTIKVAGSQEAFRAVDFEANLAVAQAALAAGARRVGLVSAMGADAGSRVFYSRVKGELESALAALPLSALVIARPSMLVGDRSELGQPVRRGEVWAMHVGRVLRPVIPRNYLPIQAADVAAALVRHVPKAQGHQVLLSGAMQPARAG